jgi:ankyrin repeat protein
MSAALKSAIESNNPAAVRDALGSVKDINAKLFDGRTAVALACKVGADQALVALLEAKAKVQGKHSEHPFAIAAENQHLKVMKVLFDHGKAPEEAMDSAMYRTLREGRAQTLAFMLKGLKPPVTMQTIMMAGQFRHPALIRALAEAGADMNMMGEIEHKSTTAFHVAVRTGDIETIKAMVECGSKINARDSAGTTPLMELADVGGELDRGVEGYDQYQENLKRRAKEQPERAQELLNSEAAKRPRPPSAAETFSAVIALGADATLKDGEGSDAIDYYRLQCRRNKYTPENPKVIEVLKKAGAKGDAATFDLFTAIGAEDVAGVKRAIAAGADVNRINPVNGEENTALIDAVSSGKLEIVNALLDAKADPNKPGRSVRPLLEACSEGNLEIVQRLIKAGADVSLRHLYDLGEDCAAMNAFETAQWASQKGVIKYLKSIGADKVAEPGKVEAGVHLSEDFAEVLVKGEVPAIADVLAKMIKGKVQSDVYEQSVKPGKRAYLVVRPKGMSWCNVFQLAPMVDWLAEAADEGFAAELCKAAGAPTLFIAYSDTSDAATSVRYEPGAKPKKKNGKESDNDWLVKLAEKEQFIAGAFRPGLHAGKAVEILFSGFSTESFDGVAYVTA